MEPKKLEGEELFKLQQIEKAMLKEIDKICIDLKIDYFLAFGTLLGAIRHGGFIPWDDDIDLGMDRDNYERFISEAPEKLEQYGLQLQHISLDPDCAYNYVKVRKKGTKYIEWCNRNSSQMDGIYIDIFVFDDAPDEIDEARKWAKKVKKLDRWYTFHQTPDISEPPIGVYLKVKQIVRRIIYAIAGIESIKHLHHRLEHIRTKFHGKGVQHIADMTYGRYRWAYYLKSDVFPIKRGKFEDIEVNFPNNPDKMLRATYNDYMVWPPEELRFGHRPYLLDFGDNSNI